MDKWFKVLDKDCKAKDGGSFNYTPFVKNGEWLPEIKDLSLCNKGYHVTKYWNMFLNNKSERVFEVEVKGLIEETDLVGVCDKAVCSSLKIIKEFKPEFKNDLNTGDRNTGNSNTGYSNTGDRNTGNWNTGNWNTSNRNTGYRNTGDSNTGYSNTGYSNTGNSNTGNWNTSNRNTGDSNTGDSNTGDSNTGNSNTGDRNTGNWNTGNKNTGNWNTSNRNTGDSNTGYSNTGNSNTGNRNTGNSNTGNWNTGDFHVGAFNTINAEKVYLFNKEILKIEYDKIVFPRYFYFELEKNYKKSWLKSFKNASQEEKEATTKLPNFDFKVFKEITGITKKMLTTKKELKK
jgi:PPE-repeat protein